MENFEPAGGWLFLAAVAYFAFMLGRLTAGGKRESPEEREMRRMNEAQASADAFAALTPSVQADVDRLLLDNKKIEAIKLFREHTGKGLKDSKDFADLRQKQIKG